MVDLVALAAMIGKPQAAAAPVTPPSPPTQHPVLAEVLATMPEATPPAQKPRVSAADVAAHMRANVMPLHDVHAAQQAWVNRPHVPAVSPVPTERPVGDDQQYAGWHTYEEWQAMGRQVRYGETSTRVFSLDQTDVAGVDSRPARAQYRAPRRFRRYR